MQPFNRILIIQTAFIGDVILATPVIEQLALFYPSAKIDFLLRKGNESLLSHHPKLNQVLIWDKKQQKYKNLWQLIQTIRHNKYDLVINLQRFMATGIITACSGAAYTIGFDKNTLSFLFHKRIPHTISHNGEWVHETDRNNLLIADITDQQKQPMRLYPTEQDYLHVAPYQQEPYVCIAPTSVWFTKQVPAHKWIELIEQIPTSVRIYLLGAPTDKQACDNIIQQAGRDNMVNLSGQLSLMQSAALMEKSVMNYVNDSAPMHLASAMNAPVTAFFCSTIPAFGFGPLSDHAHIVETQTQLDCRPCGLHGYKACPQGHFQCAETLHMGAVIER